MEDKTILILAEIASSILVNLLLGVLFATLATWVAGMFIDFPFTLSNVGKVYLVSVVFGLIRVMWSR
jgi:hypothetical protein